MGGNPGRDSGDRTSLAGPHAFASTTSRRRRRNSLAQPVRAGKVVLDRKPPRGDIKILAPRKKFCRFVTSAYTRLSNSHPEAEVSAKPPGSGRRPASAQPDADADRSLFPWRRLIQPAFPAQPAGLL